jgi:hypothetical protein
MVENPIAAAAVARRLPNSGASAGAGAGVEGVRQANSIVVSNGGVDFVVPMVNAESDDPAYLEAMARNPTYNYAAPQDGEYAEPDAQQPQQQPPPHVRPVTDADGYVEGGAHPGGATVYALPVEEGEYELQDGEYAEPDAQQPQQQPPPHVRPVTDADGYVEGGAHPGGAGGATMYALPVEEGEYGSLTNV